MELNRIISEDVPVLQYQIFFIDRCELFSFFSSSCLSSFSKQHFHIRLVIITSDDLFQFFRFISRLAMTSRPPTVTRRDSVSVHPFPTPSLVSIVLGAQWGDEVCH